MGRSGREQGRGEPPADNTSTDLRAEESIPPVTSNTAIFTELEIKFKPKNGDKFIQGVTFWTFPNVFFNHLNY